MKQLSVDGDRLRRDIETTAQFGAIASETGRGRTAVTGSEANRKAREYLVQRLEGAGLEVSVDAVGNISGTWIPPSADPDASAIAAGSHLDSVPAGGIFDGPLGVYAALEAVRTIQEAGLEPDRPVTVVSFTEEEGQRFSSGLLGSSVAANNLSVERALGCTDEEGISLETALEDCGFLGDGRLDAEDWAGWFELHVEQDTVLEERGSESAVTGGESTATEGDSTVTEGESIATGSDSVNPVGVVTSITGISRCLVTVIGEADHAGTTNMSDRTDALVAASELVGHVETVATEQAASNDPDTTVGTVGSLSVSPDAPNVIPGRVELTVDVRDVTANSIETVVSETADRLEELAVERGVETRFERPFARDPVPMSTVLRNAVHEAGEAAGIETIDLHSGAGHDTMNVAECTEGALLFVASRGGYSHSPREWTDWADCATGTRVLAGAITDVATR